MLPEIRPADASPEIASIYQDIRAVSGVPMVNLIWRHFASLPGVLAWAWDAARPLVGSEEMAAARAGLIAAVELPPLTPLTPKDWLRAGVSEAGLSELRAMMEAYVRGNATNIIALTALRLRLDHPADPAAHVTPAARPAPATLLPALPRIETLPAALASTIRAIASSHDGTKDGTIPSLYLALAPWPGLLAALPDWLGPLYAPTAMRAARHSTTCAAEAAAATLLPASGPLPAALPLMRPALDRFTSLVIPDLIPVCIALRDLLPPP